MCRHDRIVGISPVVGILLFAPNDPIPNLFFFRFKKWARRGGKMRTLYGASQRQYAQPEEQHHALLHDEKGSHYEGQEARYLPHAGSTEYGVEAYGPMDQKGSGKKTIAIQPSLSRD